MIMKSPSFGLGIVLLTFSVVGTTSALAHPSAQEETTRVIVRGHDSDCEDGEDCDDHRIHRWAFRGPGNWTAFLGGTYLGVQLTEMTPELRTHFGVPEDVGVMVSSVNEGSPAEAAGLEPGDILTAVDTEDVSRASQLSRKIRSREDGDTVVLDVWRDGLLSQRNAVLAEREGGDRLARFHRFDVECEDGEDCSDFDFDFDFDFSRLDGLHEHLSGLEALEGLPERLESLKPLRHLRHLRFLGELGDLDDICEGGPGNCEISIDCKEGDCTYTVDGEVVERP